MFTSFDKALVALVMAVLYFANYFGIFSAVVDPAAIEKIIVALTPFFVYFFPNKTAPKV